MDDQCVFWKYERNSTYYYTCKNIKNCPTANARECFCHRNQLVLPIVIGEVYCPPTYRVRSYMKIGEICAICISPILHKVNAHLTCCGHSFHKTCMLTAMHHADLSELDIVCPICRTDLGSDIGDVFHRYQNGTGLDKLENYTLRKEYMFPDICFLHYLMNKTCKDCGNLNH